MANTASSQALELEAENRDRLGKAEVRRMRRLEDLVPAVVYGTGSAPAHITLVGRKVKKFFEQPGSSSSIIDLKIDGTAESVVVKAKQRHPAKGTIMHIDFMRVDKDQALTMRVPLQFINEETAPGVKMGGGIVSHLITDVEISCKPADLPEAITVDVGALEIDSSIHLSDITLPAGVSFLHAVDADHDQAVASISAPKAESVEPAAEEATEEKPADEGAD